MKKKIKMLFALIVCALMVHTGITATAVPVAAAVKTNGTIDLKAKKLIIPNGKKTAIKGSALTIVKNCRYQVKAKFGKTTVKSNAKWKSSKPAVLSVSKTGIITAKKPGSAKLKVTYKGKTQTLKIKIVASHKHVWRIIKKATCETKGVQTCSVCGLKESIAKTSHNYVTSTWDGVEGRGKAYSVMTTYCNGCGIDMSDWTMEQMNLHQTDIDGMLAGTANMDCFNAGNNGAVGVEKFPKYVMVHLEETYCKNCGISKDKTKEDLYEVYYDEWRNVVRKSDGKILEETPAYRNYKPYLEKAAELNGTAKTATAKAVAQPEGIIDTVPDADVADTDIVIDETVSENAIISENTIIID